MSGSRSAPPAWLDARAAWAIVAAITLVGAVPRLVHLDASFFGDELSTLYLVNERGLADVLASISSDAEISPPGYFVLAWLADQLGGAPELIRVPALLAGLAAIPLTYLVGERLLSRPAGLIAAAAMALNPSMVFYSTAGRGYSIAIACLLCTTLAMLLAVESERRRWWVVFGVFTALAMYAHYTAAFVLGGQLLWLLWNHREARRAALVATAGAVVLYLPWLPSMLADFDSPTVEILSALQGDGFDAKRQAFEIWAFGYPYIVPTTLPGTAAIIVAIAGLAVGSVAALVRYARSRLGEAGRRLLPLPRESILVAILVLVTPLAEVAILLVGGNDLLGDRNLMTATPGFALLIGALGTAAGPLFGGICVVAVLGAFAAGTIKSTERDNFRIDVRAAAEFIDSQAGPDDIVVDALATALTPVPLTPLDVYLPGGRETFRLNQPEGGPPFLILPPPAKPVLEDALRAARGRRILLLANEAALTTAEDGRIELEIANSKGPFEPGLATVRFPPGLRVTETRTYDGLLPVTVFVIEAAESR